MSTIYAIEYMDQRRARHLMSCAFRERSAALQEAGKWAEQTNSKDHAGTMKVQRGNFEVALLSVEGVRIDVWAVTPINLIG